MAKAAVSMSVFEEVLLEMGHMSGDDLVSDAHGVGNLEQASDMASISPHLSKEAVVRELEDLDYYEKVSLAFLLCDEVHYILDRLVTAERARRAGSLVQVEILSEWLRCQKQSLWENKIVEAICIIQNYQVLEHLGFDVESVKSRFLPLSPESSLFVSCMRKALYRICEGLSAQRLTELLRRVRNDFENIHAGQKLEVFDVEFMEINILYWTSLGYINLGDKNGRGVDIHRLKTILKGMEETTLLDNLESAERATVNASVGYHVGVAAPSGTMSTYTSSEGSVSSRSDIAPPSYLSQHSVASTTSQVKQPACLPKYHVDPDNVGYCIIINQKSFYSDSDPMLERRLPDEELDTRLGTDVDRERVIEIFESMGFTTCTLENLTHSQILGEVRQRLEQNFTSMHSCFVLCVMSHGVQGMVYGSNSIPVSEEELKGVMMRVPQLRGKPKILIIQACQGKAYQEAQDVAEDGPRGESADFITFWSTVPGFLSFRNEIEGTWFIQALHCHFLSERVTDDIYKLFTRVNADVGSRKVLLRGSFKTMVAQFHSTLTKDLILPLQPRRQLAVSLRMYQRQLFTCLMREYIRSRKNRFQRKMHRY